MYRLIFSWDDIPCFKQYCLTKKRAEALARKHIKLGHDQGGYSFTIERLCRHWFKLYWTPAIIEVAREHVFTGEDHL